MTQDLVRFRRLCSRAGAMLLLALMLLGSGVPLGAAQGTVQPTPTMYSRYEIDAALDPALSVINADMTLDWVNTTGETQGSVFFRLYPNADYYGDGALTVLETTVDGVPVEAVLAADLTVLEVALPDAEAAGARVTITFTFQTVVPADAPDSLGILQRGARDIWSLANWYPIVAGYETGAGWYLDPPTHFGDPTFSDTADYLVRFQAPDRYRVFGSGKETARARDDGTILTEMRAPLSREFALTLMPGETGGEITASSARAGDVDLSLMLPSQFMIPGLEETVLETATDAFPVYEAWLGAYPGENLEITLGDLSGASAVSWAGTIWLDLESAVADGTLNEFEQIRLRFVIIHEIGHQWIGNVIGANTNDHQFMSEGLVNMLSVAVINEMAGPADAERYLRADVAGPYQALLRDGRDGVADRAITPELNGVLHGIFVYGKAGVGLEAIRQEIGNDAFFDGMSAYGDAFRFGIAGPDDLRGALEQASGQDLGDLWSFWFEQERTKEADVIAVLDGYAETAGG